MSPWSSSSSSTRSFSCVTVCRRRLYARRHFREHEQQQAHTQHPQQPPQVSAHRSTTYRPTITTPDITMIYDERERVSINKARYIYSASKTNHRRSHMRTSEKRFDTRYAISLDTRKNAAPHRHTHKHHQLI